MPPSPPPHQPPEGGEWRDTLLTFGPAIAVALALDWMLTTQLGWPPRRALWSSIGVGLVVALVLQRIVQRRGAP
jgi:hypothetical protein